MSEIKKTVAKVEKQEPKKEVKKPSVEVQPEEKVAAAREKLDQIQTLFVSYNSALMAAAKLKETLPAVISSVENLVKFSKGTAVEKSSNEMIKELNEAVDAVERFRVTSEADHNKLVAEKEKHTKQLSKANEELMKKREAFLKTKTAKEAHEEKVRIEKQNKKEEAIKKDALISVLKNNVEGAYGVDKGYYPEALFHARAKLRVALQEAFSLKEVEAIEWDGLVSKERPPLKEFNQLQKLAGLEEVKS